MISFQMNKKQIQKLIALIVVTALFFGLLYLTRPATVMDTGEPPESLITEQERNNGTGGDTEERVLLISDMLAEIERQNQIEEMLLTELNSGIYDFNNPLVVVNPYGMSPLTALVLFTSSEPMNISVHIPGKSELADIDFTFEGYNTVHEIPIYGLYPDELNTIELIAITQGGGSEYVTLDITTDPLPPELEKNIILADLVQPDKYQPGFNYSFVQKCAFDVNGDYRWFFNDFGLLQACLYNYNGNTIFSKGSYHEGDVLLFEANALGKIISVYYSQYGVHHDISDIDNKNLLVTGSHGDTVEDFIYEIDVESGEIVNVLDLKYSLQRTRTSGHSDYNTVDWFHNNAIIYDNESIIISGARQSAVIKLSWPEGVIEWILSAPVGWDPIFSKYLLTPINGNFEWSYAQHSPEILPNFDNSTDTVDILLFDNGISRFSNDRELQRAISNNEVANPELYSRMVHYRINEGTKTVEQIWQFGEELGETFFSHSRGDANLLGNGNRLGTFDRFHQGTGDNYNTSFIEVDPSGNIVWDVYCSTLDAASSFNAYRCERLPLYTEAANDLQIGVPARVLIPEELLP